MKTKTLYYFVFATVLYACPVNNLCAQKFTEPGKMTEFNITVNAEDCTSKIRMLKQNKVVHVDNDKVYMWYGSQKIIETRGGYDGKLIHGPYRSFYFNGQLKQKGEVQYGLKTGEWKAWGPNGELKEVIHWRKGFKKGTYILYNDLGQRIAKGRFKHDHLHGNFYTYNNIGEILEKKKYRHGIDVTKKSCQKNKSIKPAKEKKEAKPKKEKKKKPEPEQTDENVKPEKVKKGPWLDKLFKKKQKKPAQIKEPKQERRTVNS